MKNYLLIASLFIPSLVYAQEYLPKSNGELIRHHYYTLSYNEKHEQANWVYYHLMTEDIEGNIKCKGHYKADPCVCNQSACSNDYANCSYSKGHLCPHESMKLNKTSMAETFYLSNISPQCPEFKRGVWKKLEKQVRKWAVRDRDIYVITGPVFKDCKGYIGANKVTVPGYFFKVVYDPHIQKMIAFVIPNEQSKRPISDYITTVDHVEELTGINFFPQLYDQTENKLESSSDLSAWYIGK